MAHSTVATVAPKKTEGWQPKPTPGQNSDTEETTSDGKLDNCINSMFQTLTTVNDDRVKASSISTVPEQLKKSAAEAYMPKVVSIGPLHRGSRRELLYMEEIKWRCVLSLFHRTEDPVGSHKECSKRMFMLDGVVRATYADDIKFDAYDLAKIMLLDGCFLLELLISNNPQLDQKYKKLVEPEKKSPGAEIGKMPQVLSDLKLLENQVPVFILIMLFVWVFGHSLLEEESLEAAPPVEETLEEESLEAAAPAEETSEEETLKVARRKIAEETFEAARKIVNHNALILFGCNSNSIPAKKPPAAHFLELLHWSMTRDVDAIDQASREEDSTDQENNDHHSITLDVEVAIDQENNDYRSQLQRCATKLEADGVKIESLKAQQPSDEVFRDIGRKGSINGKKNEKPVVKIIFGCDIKSEGKLQIQPLYITEITEVLWRNLIAWEQNRIIHEKFLKEENRTHCKFSRYAWLFDDLVCCEHDIQLLKDRGVLLSVEDGDRRSNEDLMKLFQNIAEEIQIDASGPIKRKKKIDASWHVRFVQLIDAIVRCRIFWHLCRRIVTEIRYTVRYLYGILKRDHTTTPWKTIGVIAAIVLLGLTIAQTTFGAIAL